MPDRDKDALQARNKDTLLTARVPAGLKPRVQEAAKQAKVTVSAYVVAAIEDKLQGRNGGKTAPAATVKRGSTTRKPREARAPAAVPVAAKSAPAGNCDHRVPPGAWCKTCQATKPAKEGKR